MYSTSNNLRTILATVVVLALGFFAYEYLFKSAPQVVDTTTSGTATVENIPGKEVFDLYDKVNSISFNTSVFSSALFENLIDFTTPLPKISVGRDNPFAPIGVGGVRTTITSKTISR